MNSERNPHILSDPSGGGGCVIGGVPPTHSYGSPPGSHGGGGVDMGIGPPCPVPTPPWVKPPSNQSNSGMMTPESDVSSCSSPASSSYGASSTNQFPQQHLQQRTFYGSAANYNNSSNNCASTGSSNSPVGNDLAMNQMRTASYNTANNAISSSTNSNQMFYDASGEVVDQSQYYHHHHQQQQHFQQQFSNSSSHLHQHKTGSNCSTPNLDNNMTGDCGGESVDSSGGNFYGFYNANQSGQYNTDYHHHHQQQHHHDLHQHHDTSYAGDASGNNRMHQYYRQDSATANGVGHANYFNSSNSGYPGSAQNTQPARYNSPMVFQNNHTYGQQQQQTHQHQQNMQGQVPRRNSIESYSSEPGDMHSSYSARYGCGSVPVGPVMNQNTQQMSGHHNMPPFTASGPVNTLIKRECGNINRSSPGMNPPCSTNSMNSTGCWSPHPPQQGYFPSSSPNTSGCTSSSSPIPCSTDTGRTFIQHGYNQNMCESESVSCGNTNFYGQQQHHQSGASQFKSCAYEQSQEHHDIKEGIPSMMNKAAAVKHRSLSLSMPLPSYLENNNSARSDLEGTFVNNHRPQIPHHHGQIQNHSFNGMVVTSQQQHHHHQQCTTTGLVPPPEQNLLTPNSDDDIPFRAASAGGQSDLDSSYETMGEEGCSSTSTSVASHCMNTSGTSSCSGGGDTGNQVPMSIATSDHMQTMSTVQDCHHHGHHAHVSVCNTMAFSTSTSISCMQPQSHLHHVASSMAIGMIQLPNSTVALCSNNVDDLDDSSSDSSVALHNVISAVVENNSIETPENTMMGDDDDEVDHVVEGMISDDIPTESGFNHHHQDSQADVNVISTTTNEPEDMDDNDVGGEEDVDDNCSESSMSHINSSFTADMFCDGNSNHSDTSNSGLIIATSDMSGTNCDNPDDDGNIINSSSGDFPCFMDNNNEVDPVEGNADKDASDNIQSIKSMLDTDSTSFSLPSPTSSSPQKISKRSFSEADKDGNKPTTSVSSLAPGSTLDTLSSSFGAMLRKAGLVSTIPTGNSSPVDNATSTSVCPKSVKNDDSVSNKKKNKEENGSESSASNKSNVSSDKKVNGSSNSVCANASSGASRSCKAIDIIISSSVNNSAGGSSDNNNRVSIPKGWKREILKGSLNDNGTTNNGAGVLYISPSDTKIRNLDELKNYIGSDGTCKCGLSCPLRLEVAFSFDPKVTNMTVEDEKENVALLHASAASVGGSIGGKKDSSTSSSSSSSSSSSLNAITAGNNGESESRLLCNHKRKIPKAEDSPLISSTRDDLGDFGEKLKKRRLSGNECSGEKLVSSGPFRKDPITTSSPHNSKGGTGNNGGGSGAPNVVNVPVPFCQQSPDTTTQTPQTEMSPASSVCSDGSTVLFSSSTSNAGGNRSLTSTPTPQSSTSSTTAAAPTSKIGNSPSQGQGHCDQFVWPSPPTSGALQTSNLSSPITNSLPSTLPLITQNPASGTLWLSPTNSITTFATAPIVSTGSNSLTLNYVQTTNINNGSCLPTGSIGNNTLNPVATPSPSNAKSNPSGKTLPSPTTTAQTASLTNTSTTQAVGTSSANSTSTVKKTYQPFPAKTVKRSNSPCPNIDVRQLPLEQNRPPPIPPSPLLSSPTTLSTSKISPLVPSITTTNSAATIASLPTLPVVTNPNILFTVTPPIIAANKPEIVSLSTSTLPILPLLTTQKLPTINTSCGAPTIVTSLQQNSIFSTIDTNTLYPALQQTKESPVLLPITSKPSLPVQLPVKEEITVVSAKSNDASNKAEVISSTKTQGKDNKVSKDGDKCPLQLAQDILNRFEKKSGDKNAEVGNSNNKSNDVVGNNAKNSSSAVSTSSTSKVGSDDKGKEKSGSVKSSKLVKDGGSKVEEKCNTKTEVTSAVKHDSALPSSTNVATTKPDSVSKKATDVGTNKSTPSESKGGPTSSADVIILTPEDKTKPKVPLEPVKPPQLSSTTLPVTSVAPTLAPNTGTLPFNTIVASSASQILTENAIITSHASVMGGTPQLIFKDGLQLTDQGLTLTTSVAGPIPTISLSAVGNQIIQTSCGPVNCSTSLNAGGLQTFGHQNQIILQQPQGQDPSNGANSTFITTSSTGPGGQRYPILQTIQPLFLNSAGSVGAPLIISQPTQPSHDPNQAPTLAQQSFIYDQNGTPTATIDATGAFQSMLQPATTTMVLDPSICAGNPNLAGGKKKKKRLSKKQQQQQAQLQLQQQFILQQIQAQQQQAAAAAIAPLTIFPQSFNLGPQGFSLQPTMNFFPTPTFLTLPNLILNPADGTLFIQPSTPLPTAATAQMQPTMKLGQFPLTTTTTIPQNPQNIAPKKDVLGTTIVQNLTEPLKPATTPGLDAGSDDSRQNPTPDSSTNDLQLGLINVATGATPQTNTITLNIPAQATTTVLHNPNPAMTNKKNSKSRAVSSSSTTVKRILPQKQILPKIDSTTPSTTENAN